MAGTAAEHDVWGLGASYEAYIGRWSRAVASEFVRWLGVPPHSRWLDVGCGAGALVEAIVEHMTPSAVLGVDRAKGFVEHARRRMAGAPVAFEVGDATALPVPGGGFDAVVSGLVLNFVPGPARMVAELVRVARPGGTVALYVWDYPGRMELLRWFWEAASSLDPAAAALDEASRFRDCAPAPLQDLFTAAGLLDVETRAIDVPTTFRDFDDYWSPFLGGQGPAPGYLVSLPEDRRAALRETLRARLPVAADGTIPLLARAWAVRGTTRP